MVLVVRCPKCGNEQRTSPKVKERGDIPKKVKKCVYCGFSFKIHSNLGTSRIVRIE
jgi:transcription elongation factor Elf1